MEAIGAVRAGLDPILCVSRSVLWARGAAVGLPGTWPSPVRFAEFGQAAVRRYSGTFTPVGSRTPLPSVRFWQAWNELNAGREITPPRSTVARHPGHYRRMGERFASASVSVRLLHRARPTQAIDQGVSVSVRRIPNWKWRFCLGTEAFEQIRFRHCRTTSWGPLGLGGPVGCEQVRNLLARSPRHIAGERISRSSGRPCGNVHSVFFGDPPGRRTTPFSAAAVGAPAMAHLDRDRQALDVRG